MIKVLMSTFNGENYILEQIDSILKQTYQDFEIYIRDDGSSDQTIGRIKEFYDGNDKIKVFLGENIGYTKSFLELLKNCGEAEYYAFSDQDDVWLEDKLERAINHFSVDFEGPQLYYSSFYNCDKDLKVLGKSQINLKPIFSQCFFNFLGNGFTFVFNAKLRKIVLEHNPNNAFGHDWWIGLVALGKKALIITDNHPTALWRRSEAAVTSKKLGALGRLMYKAEFIFGGHYFARARGQLEEFSDVYKYELDVLERRKLDRILSKGFRGYFKRLFFPGRLSYKGIDEGVFRLFLMIGVA